MAYSSPHTRNWFAVVARILYASVLCGELLDTVLQAAIKTGVNQINGIRYSMSNANDINRQTLDAAITNAKEQAQYLAAAFDAKLGKVLTIQGERNWYPSNLSMVVSAPQDPFGGESYVPDTISVSRSITVVFELQER